MSTTSTVTATLSSDLAYVFTDSQAGASTTEISSLGYSLTLGTGISTGQINAAVRYTGHLPAGGITYLDFTAFPKPILGGVYDVNFTDVKGVVVENQWNGTGTIGGEFAVTRPSDICHLTIATPAASGFTGLFNGTVGTVRVAPGCTWLYNNRFGEAQPGVSTPGTSNNILAIEDVSGSGVPVSIVVVGVTG